uniref:Innexin n=1 Tax=Cryptocotyle lingua TaxID=66766 RepID=A0A7U0TIZ1_9TREM|nr:innexin 2 [Cryptocotyle lingua]
MGFELGKGFLDSLVSARSGAFSHLEDFADRLSHFISCGLILMLAGVTMANVYFLRPIACTLPTAPENQFNQFAESVCWVKGTLGIRYADSMPTNKQEWDLMRERSDISFYQWVPFCLSVQAMLFFAPHALWQSLALYTMGENLESILNKARHANDAEDSARRNKCVESAAHQLFRLARQHQDHRSTRWARLQRRAASFPGGAVCVAGKRMGNWVMTSYLFVKMLYLANALGQLFLIRTFLGFNGGLFVFGDKLVATLTAKREWEESEFFPRQTYCPVEVRHLGTKSNLYTAICALPVNMFNEKIYIFLWLWIALVAIATAISLLVWIFRLGWQRCQTNFVREYLVLSIQSQLNEPGRKHPPDCPGCMVSEEDAGLQRFIHEFVRGDGTFLLRMIRTNAGDVIAGEILTEWWHLFVQYETAECAMFEKHRLDYIAPPQGEPPYGIMTEEKSPMRNGFVPKAPNLV